MILQPKDRPWAPEECPQYLCILQGDQLPPRNLDLFLNRQVELLQRLQQQASPRELSQANRQLELDLPAEVLLHLPSNLLFDDRLPGLLLLNPQSEGSPLHQWKEGFNQALSLPPMPEAQSLEEAQGLSLESYLNHLL